IIAAAVLGLSGGLCLNAGIASTVEQVPPAARGGVSSAFFAGLYLLLAAPAIGVGLLAAEVGLRNSGLVFSAAAALLAALVGGCAWLSARRSAA
ncbi:hypothetical protein, partial [Leucobacter sp. M11]|uniref:hypothetical protein n=1 Tax=Leucobacter sp. M11 TaxID=2993565 RepID=UPI002D7EE489